MKNPNQILALLTLVLWTYVSGQPVTAAPPWLDWIRWQQVEAEADKSYALTQEHGPWMIMAISFRGPDAQKEATQLVFELRKRHKLEAYTHLENYDFSESFIGRGVDRFGNPRRMRHQQNDKFQEVAILVGNYSSVDDPQSQLDLKKIKSLTLEALKSKSGKTSRSLAELRRLHNEMLNKGGKNGGAGPMKLAFITTNPLLPDEYFRPQGVDRFVARLNEGVKHSLLKCPGKYTVKVATFTGLVTVNPTNIKKIEKKDLTSSRLEEGAIKAHRLTVALRAKGYEAYQFHDRRQSIVTVGYFDRPPEKAPGGQMVYNPQVRDLIQRFCAKQRKLELAGVQHPGLQSGIVPEKLLDIPFDVHPTLIPVPQRSLSSDFARRTLSVR
jgi:hypothetical protein